MRGMRMPQFQAWIPEAVSTPHFRIQPDLFAVNDRRDSAYLISTSLPIPQNLNTPIRFFL